MYGLSLGVQRIEQTLPGIACALLTGLNASTVGIVALAAVQVRTSVVLVYPYLQGLSLQRKRSKTPSPAFS